MAQEVFVLVGDIGLGSVQCQVLHWSIRTLTRQPITLKWASELPLEMPAAWQVKPEVGLPLLAKLWLLRQHLPGPTIYLDGNLIVQGNLIDFLQDLESSGLLVSQHMPLKSLKLFAFIPGQSGEQFPELTPGWQHQNYEQAANFLGYPHDLADSAWQPVPYGYRSDANLIDCLPLQNRPWYCPTAPGHDLWLAQVKGAVQAGYLGWEQIRADVEAQKLHPAWLEKLDFVNESGDCARPEMALQSTFIPPEIQVSLVQQQQLRDNHYPLPQKSRVKALLSSYLWEVTLPTRFNHLLGRDYSQDK